MAEDTVALWIAQLSDPDPGKRAAAAEGLRSSALDRCFSGCNDWIRDQDFLKLARPAPVPTAGAEDRHRIFLIVGIAVRPETFGRIHAASGSPRLASVPPDQDAMESELHFGPAGDLDILTTRDPEGSGAIARYLEKYGEGIQQIEVNVRNVEEATQLLRTRFALTPIYPATRAGANGTRVNFFLAPAAGGRKCLIELVEAPQETV